MTSRASRSHIVGGSQPAALANDVSDAIHAAIRSGMDVDDACCVAVAVIADYARGAYGPAYLSDLAAVIRARAGAPLPRSDGGRP